MTSTSVLVAVLLLLTLTCLADAPAGRSLAEQGSGRGVPPCASCHGADGAGNAGLPRLAGLDAGYLAKQLHDFQQGSRVSEVMQPIAKPLSNPEIAAVAAYYAGLHAPYPPPPTAQAPLLDHGEELARRGRWPDGIPPCAGCHGPDARGVPPHFPALAGQHEAYITSQLQAWQQGKRRNDPLGLMQAFTGKLSPRDIEAVAAYLARLRPGQARADAGGTP